MEWIILGAIIFYSLWVIARRVKRMKEGKFCDCGCSDCPSKIKCHKE